MNINVKQKIKGSDGLHPRVTGFPTRIVYSAGRPSISLDSIPSSYGLPVGIPIRRIVREQEEYEKQRIRRIMSFVKAHPFVLPYCFLMPLLGALLQGWIPWVM